MKQLITYFFLAYLISWLIWFPLYAPAFGFNGLPVFPFQHGVGGFGPLLAAFITTGIYKGKAGLLRLLKRCIQLKPIIYLMVALFSPFLLSFLASLLSSVVNTQPFQLTSFARSSEFPQFTFATFFCYNLLFFGFGEEVGWRGFALPRLQVKYNALVASVVLTFLWALWHWPLFFYRSGYVSMDLAGIMGWFFSLLTGSLLLSWLFNSSEGSILICAVFHATIDIAFTADAADKQIMNYMGFLITLWGIATIIVFKPKHLAKREGQSLS